MKFKPGVRSVIVTSVVQSILSLVAGFLAHHPFGCTVATLGLFTSGVAVGTAWKYRSQKMSHKENLTYWQAYSAMGYFANALGLIMVAVYSKGSCGSLVEGCNNEKDVSVASVVCLLLNAAISLTLFIMLRVDIPRSSRLNRFNILYKSLSVMSIMAWFCGLCSIDGDEFIVPLGVMCLLGGMSTGLVLFYEMRRNIMYPVLLAAQFAASVIILSVGATKKLPNGSHLMKYEVLITQLISMANLLLGTGGTFASYFLKWENRDMDTADKMSPRNFLHSYEESLSDLERENLGAVPQNMTGKNKDALSTVSDSSQRVF